MYPAKTKRQINKYLQLVMVPMLVMSLSGCSVMMAAKQPTYRKVEIVKEGASRSHLIAEFGYPRNTETTPEGNKSDLFVFKQGYGKGNKILRVLFHAAADFFTLFIWELVGSPAEAMYDGYEVKFNAVYDENDRVISYEFYE